MHMCTAANFSKLFSALQLLLPIVKILMDKSNHLDTVMVDRTSRKSTKLIKGNVWGDVRPYPLYEEPFKSFAQEGVQDF